MKKRLTRTLALLIAMMVTLSGCMAEIISVKLNADGSGTSIIQMGVSEDYLAFMMQMGEMDAEELEEIKKESFYYQGKTYYGLTESEPFSDIDEFDNFDFHTMEGIDLLADNDGFAMGFERVPGEEGCFTFRIAVSAEAVNASLKEDLAQLAASGELGSETAMSYDELLDSFVMIFRVEFPSEVRQLSGGSAGITVKGNTVEMDLMKLGQDMTGEAELYEFTNSKPAQPDKPASQFSDVPEGIWYCDAVNAMAGKGLVTGVGNGRFSPDGKVTVAQFCQIIAREKGLETGISNGYWAGKAIESCLKEGYIDSFGEVTPEHYDVRMTREQAVSGIYRANKNSFQGQTAVKPENIPDYNHISENYREDILGAYACGITTGVNAAGEFRPASNLTRAQLCQMLYSLSK